jgi:hypothetical protein
MGDGRMTKAEKRFFELSKALRRRAGMYVQPVSFATVVAFISGFDAGTQRRGTKTVLDGFVDWINQRMGHHCSLHWSAVIREKFADGDKDLALPTLFELLHEYEQTVLKAPRGARRAVEAPH